MHTPALRVVNTTFLCQIVRCSVTRLAKEFQDTEKIEEFLLSLIFKEYYFLI